MTEILSECGPPGTRVYAVGDIHGRRDLLDRLLANIQAHAEKNPCADKVLVFTGDYIDRGPDSRLVVERLCAPPKAGFRHVFLKGNHEDLLLRFLDGEGLGVWLRNGALQTLASYGLDSHELRSGSVVGDGAARLRRDLMAALPPSHLAFFEGLNLTYEEGDYLFVHAGVRPGVPLNRQRESDLLWIRQDFTGSGEDFGKIVVHGHTVSRYPDVSANRIGIDTGAWRTDCLSCLIVEGQPRGFLTS